MRKETGTGDRVAPEDPLPPGDLFDLLDWKRRMFSAYAAVRGSSDPRAAWAAWRNVRDGLFRSHPQSPLRGEERMAFAGLDYYEYDPSVRVLATVEPASPEHHDIATSGGGSYGFTRFAVASFELKGRSLELELYWLDGYAGGLFLSFKDATSGSATYGAGRYLLDTVKGADLGIEGDGLVLDFNFAYNPSCAYDPRWVCPLTTPANRLPLPVEAGERAPAPTRELALQDEPPRSA